LGTPSETSERERSVSAAHNQATSLSKRKRKVTFWVHYEMLIQNVDMEMFGHLRVFYF
jgi:SPX domain protein involved in polyphosphate accumulation